MKVIDGGSESTRDINADLQRDCTTIRARGKIVGYAIVAITDQDDEGWTSRCWTNCDSNWALASQVHALAVHLAQRNAE